MATGLPIPTLFTGGMENRIGSVVGELRVQLRAHLADTLSSTFRAVLGRAAIVNANRSEIADENARAEQHSELHSRTVATWGGGLKRAHRCRKGHTGGPAFWIRLYLWIGNMPPVSEHAISWARANDRMASRHTSRRTLL